jgi:predicted nucleotidyltransferase
MPRPVAPTSFARQPLDIILSGTASVRVMRILIGHGGPLSVSRIAKDAKVTPNGARGILYDLVRARIVHSHGSGHTQLFYVTNENPLVAGMAAMFESETERFNEMTRTIINACGASPHRVLAAWMYGSVARLEDTVASDLDIAVIFDASDQQVEEAVEEIREVVLLPSESLGFKVSIVPLSLADVWRLSRERGSLWHNLVTDGSVLIGNSPSWILSAARKKFGNEADE